MMVSLGKWVAIIITMVYHHNLVPNVLVWKGINLSPWWWIHAQNFILRIYKVTNRNKEKCSKVVLPLENVGLRGIFHPSEKIKGNFSKRLERQNQLWKYSMRIFHGDDRKMLSVKSAMKVHSWYKGDQVLNCSMWRIRKWISWGVGGLLPTLWSWIKGKISGWST